MLCGSMISGFALKGFLIPNNFLDGGVTGISLLTHEVFHLKFSIVIVAANLPLLLFGLGVMHKVSDLKILISIICVGLCTAYIPYPLVTSQKLLIAVFGGFFAGLGMGLNIRAGSAVDSMEVLALYAFKRSSFTVGEIIMAVNAVIFVIAAFHYGPDTALYSMLIYFTARRTADYVAQGIEAYTGVTIISANSERIKERLVNEPGRGITIYKGERGYLPGKYKVSTEVDTIFTCYHKAGIKKIKEPCGSRRPKSFCVR